MCSDEEIYTVNRDTGVSDDDIKHNVIRTTGIAVRKKADLVLLLLEHKHSFFVKTGDH